MKGRKIEKVIRAHLKEQFGFSSAQLDKMIPTIIQTLTDYMAELDKAAESGSLEEIGRISHMMKGALLNSGLLDSAELAREIEIKAKAGAEQTEFKTIISAFNAQLSKELS